MSSTAPRGAPSFVALLMAVAVVGCGGGPAPGRDAAPDPRVDAPGLDAPMMPLDAPETVLDAPTPTVDVYRADAGPVPEANVREVLACGTPLGVSGMGARGELQLHQVDTARFPDALCNDGTPAVLYYRPYRGEENRNRWAITLRGGGVCSNPENCAARWCSCSAADPCDHTDVRTNFTLNNMSGGGRRGSAGNGIHSRDAAHDNPIADYNHVQLIYCSSDTWNGNVRGATFTTTHPRTGVEVSYVVHFLGARILAADLEILRQDGASALVYTLDGESVPMPDLDEATDVIIAGDSGGGAGTIHNLDAIAQTLRDHHVGAGGGPEVFGLIDAIVGPDWQRLDFSMTAAAASGIDTYAEARAAIAEGPTRAGAFQDESCVAHHAPLGDPFVCLDDTHVIRHHITTPFFVRMALLDELISDAYMDSRLADPVLGLFTENAMGVPVNFAIVLQRELAAFPMLPDTAEEGARMTRAPGVFAPACANHDTIHENTEVYGTTIDPGSGPLRLFDVFEPWRSGGSPSAVLTTDMMRRDTVCPPRAP